MVNVKQLESRAATLGVLVMRGKELSPRHAAAIRIENRWYIAMSNQMCECCQALILAHELAHIILGHEGNAFAGEVDEVQEDEAWCWAWRLIDD